MVECGIVKIYFGSQSYSKGRYGFIRVIGDDGELTGEEVFFHLNRAREPHLVGSAVDGSSAVEFSEVGANTTHRYLQPRKGDVVFFTAEPNSPKRRVTAWTTQDVWLDFFDLLVMSDEQDLEERECDEALLEECLGDCGQPA